MYDVDVLTVDFGRVAKVFVNRRVAGVYYYAQQDGDEIKWVRHVQEKDVLPYFVCPKDMAKMIATAMGKELTGKTPADLTPKELESNCRRVEIYESNDGSLILSCGPDGMESDLVFASGAMTGDPALKKQQEILEWIANRVNAIT